MPKTKIIIIGAGMAGLTAAHVLRGSKHETVVIERDSRPGGRIKAINRDGDIIDVGAQFIHSNYKLTLEFCRKFNLTSDLVEMKSDDMIMRGGSPHIISWGAVRISTVSLWSQVKLLNLFPSMLRHWKGLALEGWPHLLDMDKLELATYARLKLNEECLEYVARPLMLTYSMSEPEGVSAAYFYRSLQMYLRTGTFCFKSGNDILPKAMSEDLEITYDKTVKKILLDSSGNVCGVSTGDEEIECSAVISAIPSPALLPLFDDWNVRQREFLEEFKFCRFPLVTFECDPLDEITYWGGVMDRQAGDKVSFITHPHAKYEGATRPFYLQAWPLGSWGGELIDLPDDKIIEAISPELRGISSVNMNSAKPISIERYPNTFPQFGVGAFGKLLRFKATEGFPSGLYFAGDYTEGGLIEGAAQSGYKAAQKLIDKSS